MKKIASEIVHALWKVLAAILLIVVIAATISWARSNPSQAQATTNKVMGAGASVIGWAADGVTGMTGGSAAEAEGAGGAGGTEVVMVQNTAPLRWKVGGAIRAWNRGLTTVQLKAGDCQDGLRCIKVSQVSELPPQDGRLVLGRTRTLFGLSISFNGAAVKQVPARNLAVAACHELGHALGAEHRTVKSSCMDAVIGAGVSTRPDATDFATVNKKFGH